MKTYRVNVNGSKSVEIIHDLVPSGAEEIETKKKPNPINRKEDLITKPTRTGNETNLESVDKVVPPIVNVRPDLTEQNLKEKDTPTAALAHEQVARGLTTVKGNN